MVDVFVVAVFVMALFVAVFVVALLAALVIGAVASIMLREVPGSRGIRWYLAQKHTHTTRNTHNTQHTTPQHAHNT